MIANLSESPGGPVKTDRWALVPGLDAVGTNWADDLPLTIFQAMETARGGANTLSSIDIRC